MSSGGYGETTNMAVADMSEPGSTFKVASMMVALDDGVVHPNDTIDVGNGLWKGGGSTVRDHNAHHGGYGRLSAAQTIVNSSNVGVAKIIYRGYANRPDDYVQKIRDLGFGEDLKLEIDGYARARIRKRGLRGNYVYFMTRKSPIESQSIITERQIGPDEYISYLNSIPSPDEVLVHKLRRNFVWAKQYFEVDDFIEPKRDYQVLEISCAPDQEVKFPPFIEVIKEVTGDPVYGRL